MTINPLVQFTPEEGCYFDNHRGIYMGEAVIQLAESLGMTHEEERTPDHEFYLEAWEDAENWLNSHYSDDAHYWGSTENGDFGYWLIEEE